VTITEGGPLLIKWQNPSSLESRSYVCGYCEDRVGPDTGYFATVQQGGASLGNFSVYICSSCRQPTYCDLERVHHPGVPYGKDVESLPDDVGGLYSEARRAYSVGAYTASVLACRKILMNVAVSKEAEEGLRFIEYVEFLAAKGYVAPDGKPWVDHIRTKGNEATHEIALMEAGDAEELLTFAEMLLKFVYEFPARVPPEA